RPLWLRRTHRFIALEQHPRCQPANSGDADANGHGGVQDWSTSCGNSSNFSLFLVLLLRLRVVSSGLLTLRQCSGPGVIAYGQIALSRRDLNLTISLPDFKFGPNTGGW